MCKVQPNEQTGEYDIVDVHTGETIESCDDLLAARSLARIFNEED